MARLEDRLTAAVKQRTLAGLRAVLQPAEHDAVEIASRLVAAISNPMSLGGPAAGREVGVGASIGIAFGGAGQAGSPDQLLGDADLAMYRAKQLVRWEQPTVGRLSPAEFIPVAEDTGLSVPLGARVLRAACRQTAAWRTHPECAGLEVSVNLSARQLADPALVDTVTAALRDSGLAADALWLEITESAVMADAETARHILGELRRLGVHLSIDDFGTGYSSLAYLSKIDRSFVDGLGGDPEDEAIVTLIISLAETSRLRVVAEGVETAEQLSTLRRLGCATVQGFHIGRPLPPDLAVAATGTADQGMLTWAR